MADAPDTPDTPDAPPTTRRWPRDLAILLVAGVVGAGVFALVTRDDTGGTALDLPDVLADAASATDGGAALDVSAGDGEDLPVVDPDDAVDAETAVTSFLAAEVQRDFAASFALLDGATQSRLVNVANWTQEHGSFPPITGFEVTGVDGDEVQVDLALDSKLDPVLGLIPATAESVWEVDEVGGSFRVNFDDSVITPVYPDPGPARQAALEWATAVQAGEDAEDLQGLRRLAGRAGFVTLLEESEGELSAGEPFSLPPDAGDANLLSRFGSQVVAWGAAVPITGPVDVTVVLAPVEDQWLVVGIIAP